jgi:probable O-glycosylation ligase (exosortase A-associated)
LVFGGSFLLSARNKFLTLLIVGLVLMVGVSFVPESWTQRISSTSHAEQDGSFMGRVIQWKILTLIALDNPVLGGGILVNLMPQVWRGYAQRLTSELTFVPTPPPTIPLASHSIYFQVLGENGFTGLFLFILLFWMAFRTIKIIRTRARPYPDLTWSADLAVSIRMSLMLYLATGALLPIPYLEFPYLLIGCLSALTHIQRTTIQRKLRETRQLADSAEIHRHNDDALPG